MEYIPASTIVSRTKKPGNWFGIEYNMNIYKGCCHGCIYCDSRSSCYRIGEFDVVKAKQNALEIIRDELRRKSAGVIGTGAMSDPYNPYEKELLLTRHALELADAFGFGMAIATKSTLITRDTDILSDIAEHSPVLCQITITTSRDDLAEKIEPGVPPSSKRFEAVRRLADAGIFTGILLMPVLPFLEDSPEDIRELVRMAEESGARFIYPYFGVTLRQNQRDWFLEKLQETFPGQGLAEKYLERYGSRYRCQSPRARTLFGILQEECEKRGILWDMKDITHAYRKNYRLM
ncbi:SPL family radical SAM protein [Lachnotalea sp. AF33-28]|uniref:SPL family radical SAM protein n=1 Tax=Lachnotalea sp. AF33-28 TaxID=2292046 RepID=UPI0015A08614|nr:radical SAM protein [Lachnotalea sp. AF33-28]